MYPIRPLSHFFCQRKKFDWTDKLCWLALYQVSVRPAKICLGSLSHQSYESWQDTEKQMVCLLWEIIYNDILKW